MKHPLNALFATTLIAAAHPDHAIEPGKDHIHPATVGNGSWTYETLPGWGALPDGRKLGPTHGSVLSSDANGRVYFSTDSDLAVIVYEADGTFVKTIAPEFAGFHAMCLRVEDG